MRRSACAVVVVVLAVAILAPGGVVHPARAQAGLGGGACTVLGTIGEGWWGKACKVAVGVGGKVLGGGKKAAGVISKLAGNRLLQRGVGIAAIVAWVLGGATWTIDHMGQVISHTTSPVLTAGWFTGVYLRLQALALFFTLLFICAAACEAVLRSETAVLARAVFGYLPLAALVTAVAIPITMLLLAGTDELSAGLERLAGSGATHFLTGSGAWVAAGLTAADPFFAMIAGGLVVAAGGALWVEMLIREVAVYLVVAMLPVIFASMVWPARRVWAIRTVEVLISLILAKVAIVCVLALGGAALAHASAGSLSRLLGGLALVILGAFSPWLLLRLIPIAEVASAAVGHIRGHVHQTAGVRTPESTLAGHAVAHATGRNGHARPDDAAGAVAIAELLEQMNRRAHRPADRDPSHEGNGRDHPDAADRTLAPTSPPPPGRRPTMSPAQPVREPTGSDEASAPVRFADGAATTPAARQPEVAAGSADSEQAIRSPDAGSLPEQAAGDEGAPDPSPPLPEPQDGRLLADEDPSDGAA